MMPWTLGRREPATLADRVRWAGLLALAAAAALAFATGSAFGFGSWYVPKVLVVLAAGVAWVRRAAPAQHPFAELGPANRVTLVRAIVVALLAGLLGEPVTPAVAWFAALAGTGALVLDGVDGALARRRGFASAFGARFDMETDAALILVLAALAWRWDEAGAWVLLAGLLRYGFVAAARFAPWLAAPLPPRRRRQTICVVQVIALLAIVSPVVEPPWSGPIALAAIVALVASFAIDVAWLARHTRGSETRESA